MHHKNVIACGYFTMLRVDDKVSLLNDKNKLIFFSVSRYCYIYFRKVVRFIRNPHGRYFLSLRFVSSVFFCDAVDSIESVVKLLAASMVDIKENIDDNLLASYHNGDLVIFSSFLFIYLSFVGFFINIFYFLFYFFSQVLDYGHGSSLYLSC